MPVFQFALLADNEVFTIFTLDTEDPNSPQADRIVAGLQSEPTVIEVTGYPYPVTVGDVWTGQEFVKGEG